MSRIARIAGAGLLALPLLGPAAGARAQQAQGAPGAAQQAQSAPQGQSAQPLPTAACRVRDRIGGRTCTGDVPEAACAAIANEARGTYAWTQEPCP